MTREELFRAVGEVREDQIEEAETVKKQVHPWRRIGALAACLAVIVTVSAVSQPKGQPKWKSIIYSFNPGAASVESGADAGGTGSVDGTFYRTDGPTQTARPDYSENVEIGELSGPKTDGAAGSMEMDTAWLTPEEILAEDTVIFRGQVEDLHYFQIELGPIKTYYTRAMVKATDIIRGNLEEGETYSVLYVGAKGYLSTSLSGPLEDLDIGTDAVFMPMRTDQDTGWRSGSSYFCYADLADYYLSEGMRYVFADTGTGLSFERTVYEEIADAETLDEVTAYIREKTGLSEKGTARAYETGPQRPETVRQVEEPEKTPQPVPRPQSEPLVPQIEPSVTAESGPMGAREVPGGARELPGGALAGDEKPGVNP